jgi:hypothetical protein
MTEVSLNNPLRCYPFFRKAFKNTRINQKEGMKETDMNRIKSLITLGAIAAVGLPASANAAGWSEPLTITQAFVEDSDIIAIYTSGGTQNTPGCAANAWIFVASSEERRARAWATILSALMSGKKIQFWFGDTCAAWNYHKATSVMVRAVN